MGIVAREEAKEVYLERQMTVTEKIAKIQKHSINCLSYLLNRCEVKSILENPAHRDNDDS